VTRGGSTCPRRLNRIARAQAGLTFAAIVMISVGCLRVLSAIYQSFLMMAAAPWFSFASLLVAILIIYALATSDKKGVGYR
jgi:hypothetical protein